MKKLILFTRKEFTFLAPSNMCHNTIITEKKNSLKLINL